MSSLTEVARYAFEAVEGDTVSTITPSEHDGGYSLNYEARSTAGLLTLTDYWHILYLHCYKYSPKYETGPFGHQLIVNIKCAAQVN